MSSKSPSPIRPGTTAPASGLYREVGPRGGNPGREVTVPQGHSMPPTTGPGRQYVLDEPADNKSGKGR